MHVFFFQTRPSLHFFCSVSFCFSVSLSLLFLLFCDLCVMLSAVFCSRCCYLLIILPKTAPFGHCPSIARSVFLLSPRWPLRLRIVLPLLGFLIVLPPLALLLVPPPLGFATVFLKAACFPYYPPAGRCVCAYTKTERPTDRQTDWPTPPPAPSPQTPPTPFLRLLRLDVAAFLTPGHRFRSLLPRPFAASLVFL